MQTNENNNELPISALLRLAADDELTPEQDTRLRAHLEAHPEDQARIDFERGLKDACGCACSTDCCAPEQLRERVMACCEEQRLADGLERRSAETTQASFWSRRTLVRYAAVAAALVVVAVGSFMVGRAPIQQSSEFGTQLASFARKEHGRCAVDMAVHQGKFTVAAPAEVPGEFQKLVGEDVTLADILDPSDGLRFVDAGRCRPPGGEGLHIRFSTGDVDDSSKYVSLWVQREDGSASFEEGTTYCGGTGCDKVSVWVKGGVRYVLICSQEEDDEAAQKALGAPVELAKL